VEVIGLPAAAVLFAISSKAGLRPLDLLARCGWYFDRCSGQRRAAAGFAAADAAGFISSNIMFMSYNL
jgi:hypothetical protein